MTRYSVPMEAITTVGSAMSLANVLDSIDHSPMHDPIGIILSSSGVDQIVSGESLDISLTVTNKGGESAVIDIFLDELPVAIQAWCRVTHTQLALEPGEGEDVTFRFDVPTTALSGAYRYWLVVDAPYHYPDRSPQRYEHTLQVLPPPQSLVRKNNPTFVVEPATTHTKPIKTLPGNPLQFQIHVFNRTDRVDSFRLHYTDLPDEWVRIDYPQGFNAPGLAIAAAQLDLSPDMNGVILLTITPPPDALCQTLLVTLQIKSKNQPDLKLLDVLYIHIGPLYQLTTHFRTLVSRIQQQAGQYSIQASNQGNTPRTVDFQVVGLEGSDLCDYAIAPPSLTLAPYQTLTTHITLQPKNPWKRPLFGGGRVITFEVVATDPENHPLPETPLQGLLMWEARPWWQILPIVLLLLGSFIGLIWLAWWIFIRPPAPVNVLRFAPEHTTYEASRGDAIHVGFEIDEFHRIQQLDIIGQSSDGKLLSGPLTFDFDKGLPAQLAPFCATQRKTLTCRNVRTDAKRAGEYVFLLNIIPKPGRNAKPTQLKALPVSIAPIPVPSIVAILPSAARYIEAPPIPRPPLSTDASDSAANTQGMSVQAISAQGNPAQGNPTPARSTQAPSAQSRPTQHNATQAPSVDHSQVELPSPAADPYVARADWQISDPKWIRGIQLVGRDADKAVASPPLAFDFLDGMPPELADFCTLTLQLLECKNVPTGLRQAGTYTIDLIVTPRPESSPTPITATSEPTHIQPRPPHLRLFTVNGAPAQSKYLVPIDDGDPAMQIELAWEVEDNPGTTVTLTPAPGNVPTRGRLPIPLSPKPGEMTVSLQVKNSAGELLTRSLTITTYDPTPEKPTVVVNTGDAAGSGNGSSANGSASGATNDTTVGPPVPSRPGTVSPSELPPPL